MPANFSESKFTIAEGVVRIGEYAFGNCRNLTRVYGDESTLRFDGMVYWNTPATMKRRGLIGDVSGEETYDFHDLDYENSYNVSYRLHDNNAVSIHFEKLYGELTDYSRCETTIYSVTFYMRE